MRSEFAGILGAGGRQLLRIHAKACKTLGLVR